jgi:hypothetical protein
VRLLVWALWESWFLLFDAVRGYWCRSIQQAAEPFIFEIQLFTKLRQLNLQRYSK